MQSPCGPLHHFQTIIRSKGHNIHVIKAHRRMFGLLGVSWIVAVFCDNVFIGSSNRAWILDAIWLILFVLPAPLLEYSENYKTHDDDNEHNAVITDMNEKASLIYSKTINWCPLCSHMYHLRTLIKCFWKWGPTLCTSTCVIHLIYILLLGQVRHMCTYFPKFGRLISRVLYIQIDLLRF